MIQEREYMRYPLLRVNVTASPPVLTIHRPTVSDCKPGDVLEVDGLSGTHLLAWSRRGLLLVSSEDAFAVPAAEYMERKCRFIRSVLQTQTQ